MAKAKALPKPEASTAGTSIGAMLIAIVLVTLVGGGIGAFLGMKLSEPDRPKLVVEETEEEKEVPVAEDATIKKGAVIIDIRPIVTTLAAPEGTWLRIESSIVLKPDNEVDGKLLAAKIGEDMIAYLRTVPLQQIAGADGFQNLRDDLIDRAKTRSEGKVDDVILRSVIIE